MANKKNTENSSSENVPGAKSEEIKSSNQIKENGNSDSALEKPNPGGDSSVVTEAATPAAEVNDNVTLVNMVRRDSTANVHPNEVDNFKSCGWLEK